jgi:D-serine deaminase-like pyridoxal phosphate-dependent protein
MQTVSESAGEQAGASTGDPSPGETAVGTERSYDYYRVALAEQDFPCAFVDLDRIDANIAAIRERAQGTPVRIASKSVRCRAVLDHALAQAGFEGLMCYSGKEARYLAAHGFDDLLVAYPVWQASEIEAAAEAIESGADVLLMVDSVQHVERLAAFGQRLDTTIPVCLDLDLSTEHFGIHFGVRRSGIQDPEAALTVCDAAADAEGVELDGLMGYEAQLAGIPDDSPANNALMNAAIRLLKRRSRPQVRKRRTRVVRAIERAGHGLGLVNGGGTGCVEFAVGDPSVTEVTVGSGLYAPALFDYYRRFQHLPAAGFAIEVTRNPAPGIYTCRGGGYIASGPPQVDRQPKPWLLDVEFRDEEGAGEVQTPVLYEGSRDLDLGDPVFFRHAKAGELTEQFEQVHLIRGGEVVETVPTYRGDGRAFL